MAEPTQAASPVCAHYYSWKSPAGSRHSARICMSCHWPDPAWLDEVYGERDALVDVLRGILEDPSTRMQPMRIADAYAVLRGPVEPDEAR